MRFDLKMGYIIVIEGTYSFSPPFTKCSRRLAMTTRLLLKALSSVAFSMYAVLFFAPASAYAHCDTLDGPVVATAKKALEKGDVTPVLKWVKKENDEEIRKSFAQTLAVRKLGVQAKELADMYFFETLVRLHRAGEGAPYTGLKPAGIPDPIVAASDRALENGKTDELKKHLAEVTASGIQKRFDAAFEAKKHADENVEAGRKFVAAYVEYVHYVEGVFLSASGEGAHHPEPGEAAAEEKHTH